MTKQNIIILFLSTFILFGCISLYLGQDNEADTRGYHSYIAWAWLHDQTFEDIAVDYWGSYYNPIPEMPWYLLQHWTNSARVTAFILGGIHGMLELGVGLLAYWLLGSTTAGIVCAVAATLSPSFMQNLGTSYHDNEAAILALIGLFLMFKSMRVSSWKLSALSGLMFGLSLGWKLTGVMFVAGCGAVWLYLLISDADHVNTLKRSIIWGCGLLIGFAIVQGYWSYYLWQQTGSPFFPLYNQIFQSPLAEPIAHVINISCNNVHWSAQSFTEFLTLPYAMATKSWWTWNQYGLITASYLALSVATIGLGIARIVTRKVVDRELIVLLVFIWVTFITWAALYGPGRYLILIDCLIPIVILSVTKYVFNVRWMAPGIATVALVALFSHQAYCFRIPFAEGLSFSDVQVPTSNDPEHIVVFLPSQRGYSFLVPEFDPRITFVGLWSVDPQKFVRPEFKSTLSRRINSIIADTTNNLYVMYSPQRPGPFVNLDLTFETLALWGMAIDTTGESVLVKQRYDRGMRDWLPYQVIISPVERIAK
jgi:hypothetical protein